MVVTGLIPNLFGVLIIISTVTLINLCWNRPIARMLLGIIAMSFSVLTTYTLYVPLVTMLAWIELTRRLTRTMFTNSLLRLVVLIVLVSATSALATYILSVTNPSFLNVHFSLLLWRIRVAYLLEASAMFSFLFRLPGIFIPFSFAASLLFLLKKENSKASYRSHFCLLYTTLTFFLIISPYDQDISWWTISNRTIALDLGLSYAALLVSVYFLFPNGAFFWKSLERIKVHFRFTDRVLLRMPLLASLLVCISLVYPISAHLTNPYIYEGFGSDGDKVVARWVNDNLDASDLLLNDRSYPGLYLLSFRAFNVVNTYLIWDPAIMNRSFELNEIFDHPSNYSLFRELALKWSLKYVWVTSQSGYWRWRPELFEKDPLGLGGRYEVRPFEQAEYLSFFDNNPYLRTVIRCEDSALYSVHLQAVQHGMSTLDVLGHEKVSLIQAHEIKNSFGPTGRPLIGLGNLQHSK